MYAYLLIAAGGALGASARQWLSHAVAATIGADFPWGTLAANILGSLAIGFFATLTGPDGRLYIPGEWRQFFMVGVCGGFTTFSSFSLQTMNLIQVGEIRDAALNIGLSVVLCLAAVYCGHVGARWINA